MTRPPDPAAAKVDLRARIRAGRRALTGEQIETSRAGVRAHVLARLDADAALGRPWRRVFAYEARPDEPASVGLLAAMADRGASIYVPSMRPDRDLDWRHWPEPVTPGPEPVTLGPGAVAAADVVLVPAFAVDRSGVRLGRGGGSYDRALARLRPATQVIAILHAGELVSFVPAEAWDQPVTTVVTADGWFDVPPPTRPATIRH